jgi:cell wall-associated NlpC family hydrolase
MNPSLRYAVCTLCFVLLILSCSTGPLSAKNESSKSEGKSVKAVLYRQFKEWKGVRHKDGGLSKSGVDCSGFVYLTMKNRFAMEVPRSTEKLSMYGRAVSRRKLAPGDLVFFKTGIFKRHVGIYVEDGKFIHASKSKGVMLSDMDNVYWNKRFWKAKRVLKMKA